MIAEFQQKAAGCLWERSRGWAYAIRPAPYSSTGRRQALILEFCRVLCCGPMQLVLHRPSEKGGIRPGGEGRAAGLSVEAAGSVEILLGLAPVQMTFASPPGNTSSHRGTREFAPV